MKTEAKYRIALSTVLVFTVALTVGALNAIDSLQNTLEDIDEDRGRRIKFNKEKKVSKAEAPLPNSYYLNKLPAPVPANSLYCPVGGLDELHRSILLNKDK